MNRLATCLLMAGLTSAPSAAATAERPAGAEAPATVIAQLHAVLLENMRAGETRDCAARKRLLEPIINEHFDAAGIARAALQRHWRDLDEERQEVLTRQIARLVLLNYARRFERYRGERFADPEVTQMEGDRRAVVQSTLLRPNRDDVPLNYVLQRRQEGWRIVNVIAGGVSDLALRSAQYASVIRNEGMVALLQRLSGQVDQESAAC